jgi:superfamily II DNA or RNA helicase
VVQPRGWQAEALSKFTAHKPLAFLLEATPGAGKTIFSALCARTMFERETVDFAVIVVPTTALKDGFLRAWNEVGLSTTSVLKEGRGYPRDFRGGIVTYQQLPSMATTVETWRSNGARMMFVLDEVHHASDDNRWGAAAESCGRCATKVLAMTGTPFRGDGRRISFVSYDDSDVARPDHRYEYKKAVRDRVCRPVVFMTDDGVAQYVLNEVENEVRLSEASEAQAGPASSVIFRRDSHWLGQVITKADAKLDEYRAVSPNAGGLVICRPGSDDGDDRHLMHVAKLVREITGDMPEVITYDDADANDKIARFREGTARWLCSVRKVSEGVDIKRLRVAVLANRPTTELLFRQIVGRVVRVDDPRKPGDATVFLAKFPQLTEWAERIADEAKAGIEDAEKRKPRDGSDKDRADSAFVPGGSTHEDGGAISDFGESYSADEVRYAEEFKRGDPELLDIPVAKIAHVLRRANIKPEPSVAAGEPLYAQKMRLRKSINNLVRSIAIKRDPQRPSFPSVWMAIHRAAGVSSLDDLMDNHSIDVMRQVEAVLRKMLSAESDERAA